MFRALQAKGLTLKPFKFHFEPKKVHNLGHVLSAYGIRIGENRKKASVDLKTTTTITKLRYVLGTIDLVRNFIPNPATIIDPLVAFTRKLVANLRTLRNHWGPQQDAAFYQSKKVINLCFHSALFPVPQVVYNPCRRKRLWCWCFPCSK